MRATSTELRALGHESLADRFADCGASCWVRSCLDCHEQIASVQVNTSCDLRICPFCARSRARERAELLSRALDRVPDYVRARASATVAGLALAIAERERVAGTHERCAAAATASAAAQREAYETGAMRASTLSRRLAALAAAHERYTRLAMRARDQAKSLRFDLARAEESLRDSWSWKLVTVSPPWNPSDEHAYSVEGLRARARDAWERWERLRARYSAGGLAAAVASIELSDAGHVHVHALVFGPWIEHTHAVETAGCIVDVRAIEPHRKRATLDAHASSDRASSTRRERSRERSSDDPATALRSAVREACKYIVKVPSPLRSEWVAGRSARAIHPALAAAWVVAMRGAKSARAYGPARDAIACERAQQAPPAGESQRVEHCRSCGSLSLSDPRHEYTPDIARILGLAWGPTLRTQRRKHKPPDS